MNLSAFKAYDIRGRIPTELNEELAYRIGRAYVEYLGARKVIIGRDVRLSSQTLSTALARGLSEAGADVHDIGLCGTEMVYFATDYYQMDGGIMITASHNPMDYNGMKLVREQSRPISGDTGLLEIRQRVAVGQWQDSTSVGTIHSMDIWQDYCERLLSYIDSSTLAPLKVVVNAGNGGAGEVIDHLESHLPFEFIRLDHEPDGNFPNGIPNPLLPENRRRTAEKVKECGADVGIAWDGDYDRCFFFDEAGNFIESYYIISLIAENLLAKEPGAAIIHDPRLTWNTKVRVAAAAGIPIQHKTGHAFIKERMRSENAAYGGEMSGHHYFRDFAYCDSGMIPWLLVLEQLCRSGKQLSSLVAEQQHAYPVSGEINRTVTDANAIIKQIEASYSSRATFIDHTDGLGMEFTDWRFNLRSSNTEPLLRLNVESRGNAQLMHDKTDELLQQIGGQ